MYEPGNRYLRGRGIEICADGSVSVCVAMREMYKYKLKVVACERHLGAGSEASVPVNRPPEYGKHLKLASLLVASR